MFDKYYALSEHIILKYNKTHKHSIFLPIFITLFSIFPGKSPFFPGVEEAGVASGAGAGSPSGPADQTQDVVSRLSAAGELPLIVGFWIYSGL